MAQLVRIHPGDKCLLEKNICQTTALISAINSLGTGNRIITEVTTPPLPYTIPDNVYHSYTIITTGTVSLDGVSVPEGSYSFGGGVNDLLDGTTITSSGGGSVVITSQRKA